jgi:hypothetical protein
MQEKAGKGGASARKGRRKAAARAREEAGRPEGLEPSYDVLACEYHSAIEGWNRPGGALVASGRAGGEHCLQVAGYAGMPAKACGCSVTDHGAGLPDQAMAWQRAGLRTRQTLGAR